MKVNTGNSIKLGLLVSASVILFIASLYLIGEKKQLFSSTIRISGVFSDINGLLVGNNVRFSGINVGIVEYIVQVSDSTVRVDMLIETESKKFMKKNAMAIIGSDGLMGNKMVTIIPGDPGQPELENRDFIETTRAVSIDDIMEKLKVTSDNAAVITSDLAAIIGNIRYGNGTLGKIFMDSAFAQTVDDAMNNIKQGAGGFKQNMDAAGHNVLLRGYLKKKNGDAEKKQKN